MSTCGTTDSDPSANRLTRMPTKRQPAPLCAYRPLGRADETCGLRTRHPSGLCHVHLKMLQRRTASKSGFAEAARWEQRQPISVRRAGAAVDHIHEVVNRLDAKLLAGGFVPPDREVHWLDEDAGKGAEYNLYRYLRRDLDRACSALGGGESKNRSYARKLMSDCVGWCTRLLPYSCMAPDRHNQPGSHERCDQRCFPEIIERVRDIAQIAGFRKVARKLRKLSR